MKLMVTRYTVYFYLLYIWYVRLTNTTNARPSYHNFVYKLRFYCYVINYLNLFGYIIIISFIFSYHICVSHVWLTIVYFILYHLFLKVKSYGFVFLLAILFELKMKFHVNKTYQKIINKVTY